MKLPAVTVGSWPVAGTGDRRLRRSLNFMELGAVTATTFGADPGQSQQLMRYLQGVGGAAVAKSMSAFAR